MCDAVGFEEFADEAVGGAVAPDVEVGDFVLEGDGAAGELPVVDGEVTGDVEGAGQAMQAAHLLVEGGVFLNEFLLEESLHRVVETELVAAGERAAIGIVTVIYKGSWSHFEGLAELLALGVGLQGVPQPDHFVAGARREGRL